MVQYIFASLLVQEIWAKTFFWQLTNLQKIHILFLAHIFSWKSSFFLWNQSISLKIMSYECMHNDFLAILHRKLQIHVQFWPVLNFQIELEIWISKKLKSLKLFQLWINCTKKGLETIWKCSLHFISTYEYNLLWPRMKWHCIFNF